MSTPTIIWSTWDEDDVTYVEARAHVSQAAGETVELAIGTEACSFRVTIPAVLAQDAARMLAKAAQVLQDVAMRAASESPEC